jgi:NADH-quinone oxidoreductase subunit N
MWLVGLAVVNSFVSLYYYLMVMRQMYLFDPPEGLARFRVDPVLWVVSAGLMAGVVAIGVYPGPFFEVAENATGPLYGAASDVLVARN